MRGIVKFFHIIASFLISILSIAALILVMIGVGNQISWGAFDIHKTNEIVFIVSGSILAAYILFSFLGIFSRFLKGFGKFLLLLIQLIGLAIMLYTAVISGKWLADNECFKIANAQEFIPKPVGIINLSVFSITVGISAIYVIFGIVLLATKKKRNANVEV